MAPKKNIAVKMPLRQGEDVFSYEGTSDIREVIQQNFKNLVLTSPGERVMIPSFGVGIRDFLFENQGISVRGDISSRIREQVQEYMPFIKINDVRFIEDENILFVQIHYYVPSLGAKNILDIRI